MEGKWTPECVEAVRAWLIDVAQRGAVTTYGETAARAPICGAVSPHFSALNGYLFKVSQDEHLEGRPLLTAVVVHSMDGVVGGGFYKMARELGKHTGGDDLAFWVEELNRVHAYWSSQRPAPPGGS